MNTYIRDLSIMGNTFRDIYTHVLVFLEEYQVLGKVLPDELFDDLLLDARIEYIRNQAGISKHVTRAPWSLCECIGT